MKETAPIAYEVHGAAPNRRSSGGSRFAGLTNGFSKKLRNHRAAVALYVAHYNLCRVHETIRMTPAMALGVADHIWTIGELVEAATNPEDHTPPEGRRHGRFTVIDGGVS